MSADTTLMMVTYNRLDLTKETFEGALKYTGRKYNLIVVDNGSTDGTTEWLQSVDKSMYPEMDGLKIVLLTKNKGIAYGRSKCLAEMFRSFPESVYLGTIDNDVAIPNKNWLADCIDVLNFAPKAGLCAVNYEGKTYPKTSVKTETRTIPLQIILRTPGTATIVFRRSSFEKIGYFVNYGTYGHEDAAQCLKLRLSDTRCSMLYYLDEPGIHLGEGERDVGEYRKMKTEEFNRNYSKFVNDLRAWSSGAKSLYTTFVEEE